MSSANTNSSAEPIRFHYGCRWKITIRTIVIFHVSLTFYKWSFYSLCFCLFVSFFSLLFKGIKKEKTKYKIQLSILHFTYDSTLILTYCRAIFWDCKFNRHAFDFKRLTFVVVIFYSAHLNHMNSQWSETFITRATIVCLIL